MNDVIGFMSNSIIEAANGYTIEVKDVNWHWDRQTIVIIGSSDILKVMSKYFNSNRRPTSHYECEMYSIDGFVNLNYDISERDPANRNVRIVYCDSKLISYNEIINRFQNSYIIHVRGEEQDGTSRIGRTVPKISR